MVLESIRVQAEVTILFLMESAYVLGNSRWLLTASVLLHLLLAPGSLRTDYSLIYFSLLRAILFVSLLLFNY